MKTFHVRAFKNVETGKASGVTYTNNISNITIIADSIEQAISDAKEYLGDGWNIEHVRAFTTHDRREEINPF